MSVVSCQAREKPATRSVLRSFARVLEPVTGESKLGIS